VGDISREGDEQFARERYDRDAMRRVRPRSEPTRWRNHQLRALSGWYLTHMQASSIIVVHRRGFPAFEIPCSWSMLDGAIKYGDSTEVSLTSETGRAVVVVEDGGPDIPRGEQEKVFDPFYRIEGSRNPDTGGVGLGLSVAVSIARGHGGDIVLAPRKGGGLSARLELAA
jgi:hypothetical protein